MLKFTDFNHLPQLDPLIARLIAEKPGLVVVAGMDPNPVSGEWLAGEVFLPSGRPSIFSILAQQMVSEHPGERAVVLTRNKELLRVPRQLKRRIAVAEVEDPMSLTERAAQVISSHPDLLIIDQLDLESASIVIDGIQNGIRVLSQIDTIAWGAGVMRELEDVGIAWHNLACPTWIVTVKRMPRLCQKCRTPMEIEDHLLHRIGKHWTGAVDPGNGVQVITARTDSQAHFYSPGACSSCQDSGRSGDVAVFDVFCVEGKTKPSIWPPSLLPLDAYVYQLAVQGDLALDDYLWIESDHLRRTYQLFSQSKRANQDTDAALLRKVIELEAANRVLRNRTEVLLSLQDLDQALTASASLDDLAPLVCREVSSLCGADRVILYYLRDQETAEVLAVQGWPRNLIHHQLARAPVTALVGDGEPGPYKQLPPGVKDPPLGQNGEKLPILVGMRVPLMAQDNAVGLMIVHSTRKKAFSPAEMTLLQTYANQAAVAIQRAGLIEELRSKIVQLEEAQTALVEKEKIEHELELARQVQQSMLPRTFPVIPGYSFAARNQPARQVGGDFFDLIVLDDDHFGVAIADVSDKGMPAALFMALSRSLLLAEARRDLSPKNVLSNVNRLLMELGEDRQFVSIFYGVFELSSRKMCFCRAGHETPFLIRGDQIHPLRGKGTILGVLEPGEMELSEEQIVVEPGDRIILYTDGLTDSINSTNQFFGINRLTKTIQANAELSAQAFCAATFDEIAAYQGSAGQFDDMTMLVVEVT